MKLIGNGETIPVEWEDGQKTKGLQGKLSGQRGNKEEEVRGKSGECGMKLTLGRVF